MRVEGERAAEGERRREGEDERVSLPQVRVTNVQTTT